jgi:hypothetical protein
MDLEGWGYARDSTDVVLHIEHSVGDRRWWLSHRKEPG